MKNNFKRNILLFFALINIFFLSAVSTNADWFSLSNGVQVENDILNDLGVNKGELKNMIQTANVMRQKKSAPQVMLNFSPTNPVPGEKVTVTATPTYFLNTQENQYFTWILKNKKCTDSTVSGCDLDGNGDVDVEDFKIKAARIIASNDFTWDADGDGNPDASIYGADSDSDGYQSSFGGDDQKGKTGHCYFHDIESGNEYEFADCKHLFPQPFSDKTETGNGGFGKDEEAFWRTNPKAKDTAGTGDVDEANVVGLGRSSFTFNYSAGDKIGVAVEGISTEPTQDANASYKTMWAFNTTTCSSSSLDNDPSKTSYPKTTTTGPVITTFTVTGPPDLDCTKSITTTVKNDILTGTRINDNATIRSYTTITTTITCIDHITLISATPPSPYLPLTVESFATCGYGEVTTTDPNQDPPTPIVTYTCAGSDLENQPVLDADEKPDVDGLNNCLEDSLVTPAEGGGSKQQMDVTITYGPENPINDESVDGTGTGDELSFKSTVVGGQNPGYLNYEWQVYASDDPSTDDWGVALSKTKLKDATQTIGLGVDTFKFKLNFQGTETTKNYLKIKLIVKDSVADETADVSIKEGKSDVIVHFSSSKDAYIKVYPTLVSLNATNELLISAIDDDTTKEKCLFTDDSIAPSTITPAAICEVAKNEILAIEIINKDALGNTIYDDFLWTVDGKTLTCPSDKFIGCVTTPDTNGNQVQSNISYFPILKEIDSEYLIGLSAVNTTTGKQVNLTRAFKVVNPSVKIKPTEKTSGQYTCRGMLLGNYIDLDGKPWPDRSETTFKALTGNNIKLTPVFSGINLSALEDIKNYQWTIDGQIINQSNVTEYGGYGIDPATGVLTLPEKNTDESYTISFSMLYTQDASKKKALNKYWDLSYNNFYEKQLTHAIGIKMVSAATELAKAKTPNQKILATISAGIPSYIAFLFRLGLSGFVLIFGTKILLFLSPKTKKYHYNDF